MYSDVVSFQRSKPGLSPMSLWPSSVTGWPSWSANHRRYFMFDSFGSRLGTNRLNTPRSHRPLAAKRRAADPTLGHRRHVGVGDEGVEVVDADR